MGKLWGAELNQRVYAFCMNLLGAEGMLFPETKGYELDRTKMMEYTSVHAWFLRSRANSIEGGTSEVMRNILGERVLGLPGEPRVDKGVAFRDLLRN